VTIHPLKLRKLLVDAAKPHFGGGESISTATLAPELRPLFNSAVAQMQAIEGNSPVTSFLGRNPQNTVPLSQSEREGIGMARGLENPSGINALALQQILRLPGLAGAGPGTGVARTDNVPDIRTLLNSLQNPTPTQPINNYVPGPFGPDPHPGGTISGGGDVAPPEGGPPKNRTGPSGVGVGTDVIGGPTGAPRRALPAGNGLPNMSLADALGATPTGVPARLPPTVVPPRGEPAPPPGPIGVGTPPGPTGAGTPPRMPPVTGTLPPRPPPTVIPPRPGYEGPPIVPPPPPPPPPPGGGPPGPPPGGVPGGLPQNLPAPQGADTRALSNLQDFSLQGLSPDNNYAFFDQSPTIKAAMKAFEAKALPTIQNQANLSGLGRSTAASNAIANAQGQIMTPLLQSELDRQERSSVRTADATRQQIQDLLQLSGAEQGRQTGAVNTLMQTGGVERGVGQSAEDAAYQDFLRRQALSETGTFLPFGQSMPSAFGSRVSTSK